MGRQDSCEDRVESHLEDRIEDLRTLWDLHCEDSDASDDDLGNMYEYGLVFDYVAPETFNDQPEGYFRYQLSWGGPGDEFRIYAQRVGEYNFSAYRIEYWFLDWFDGAHRVLEGDNLDFLKEIFTSFFVESGSADHILREALEKAVV